MCGHYLNKYLKNKDSQRSKQPKDLDSFFYHGFDPDIKIHKGIESLILSVVILKKYE